MQYFVSLDKERILACFKRMNDEHAELELFVGGSTTVIELATQLLVKFKHDGGSEFARFESKSRSLNFNITNDDVGKCKFRTSSYADKDLWIKAIAKGDDRNSDADIPDTNEPVSDRGGWLFKLGGSYGKWQKRFFYCDVKRGTIEYRKTDNLDEPLGLIDCSSIQLIRHSYLKSHAFAIHTPGRVYYCRCDSEEQRREWVSYLKRLRHSLLTDAAKRGDDLFDDTDVGPRTSSGKTLSFVSMNRASVRNLNPQRQRTSIILPALAVASSAGQITTQKHYMKIKQANTLLRRALSIDGATIDSAGVLHRGSLFWNAYHDAEHGFVEGAQQSYWLTLNRVAYAMCDPQSKRPLGRRMSGLYRQDSSVLDSLSESLSDAPSMLFDGHVLPEVAEEDLPPSPAFVSEKNLDEPAGVYITLHISQSDADTVAVGAEESEGSASDDSSSTVLRTEVQAVPFAAGQFNVQFSKAILIELRRQWAAANPSTFIVLCVHVANRISSSKFRMLDRGKISLLALRSNPECAVTLQESGCQIAFKACSSQHKVGCFLPQIFAPIQKLFRLAIAPRPQSCNSNDLSEEGSELGEPAAEANGKMEWLTVVDQVRCVEVVHHPFLAFVSLTVACLLAPGPFNIPEFPVTCFVPPNESGRNYVAT